MGIWNAQNKKKKKTKQDKIDKHIPVFHDLKLHWIRNLHRILFGLISLWNLKASRFCLKLQICCINILAFEKTNFVCERIFHSLYLILLLFSVHIQEFKWINCKAQSVFHTCFCSGSWRLWSWWTWRWCRVSFRVQILPKTGS